MACFDTGAVGGKNLIPEYTPAGRKEDVNSDEGAFLSLKEDDNQTKKPYTQEFFNHPPIFNA